MHRKNPCLFRLFPISLILFFGFTACGNASPVTIEQIPVIPNTTPVAPGNVMAETIAGAIRDNAKTEAVDVEIRIYTLPEETPWETVQAFYLTEIPDGDWKATNDLLTESDYVNTIGWTRGSLSSEQALLIGHSIDPLGGPPFLMLMLFTE